MIPKIFHFIWIGSDEPYIKGIQSKIKLYGSEFKYYLWTNRLDLSLEGVEIKNINEFHIPDIRQNSTVINNTNTLKADLYRLLILYKYGGIYSDLDSISVKKIPEYFFEKDYVSCYENSIVNPGNISGVIIGFFMAKPSSEAIRNLIVLRDNLPYEISTNKIGLLLGDIDNVLILPSNAFVPLNVLEIPKIVYLDKLPDCYEVHLYHGYNKYSDYEEKSINSTNT